MSRFASVVASAIKRKIKKRLGRPSSGGHGLDPGKSPANASSELNISMAASVLPDGHVEVPPRVLGTETFDSLDLV